VPGPGGAAVSGRDLQDVAGRLEAIARDAGAVLRAHDSGTPRPPRLKGVRDPVTDADLASERLIVERLRDELPEAAIFSEEETREAPEGPCVYVDPLDGTVNFSQAHPFYAVSIALYEGAEPLAGVVHAPRLDETFVAVRGRGAICDGRPARVSDKDALIDAVLATGFAYARNEVEDDNVGHFARLVLKVRGLRRCGSAALDLAYTACGRLDGFWEPHLNPFDVAAGALLVREAGGIVTDMAGGDDWLHGRSICAAGAPLHAALLAELGATTPA